MLLMASASQTWNGSVQVQVDSFQARQPGLVGRMPAPLRSIVHGHVIHRQLHESDRACCNEQGTPGEPLSAH